MNITYTVEHIQKGPTLFVKENRARYRAISKSEPVVCVHCGAKIETK